MALQVSLLASRACLSAARARAPSLGAGGGTCSGRTLPPCPPCRPAPQPPCRARAPTVRRALRQVCCAPPQGARPPCELPRPACALNCTDVTTKKQNVLNAVKDEMISQNVTEGCDRDLDPVALRLKLAKRARRADYEREVKRRNEQQCHTGATPPAPYRLGGERECARATDGCMYAMPSQRRAAAPARCGPDRKPPPPRCVELVPDDGCRIKGDDVHLDPCAHRPRVMIEIDRSTNNVAKRDAPLKPRAPPSLGNVAKRAGDESWCKNPPTPVAVPQPCRRLSIVERLRGRSASHLSDSQDKRRLHTCAVLSKSVKSASSTSAGIEGVLRSKEKLNEAGVGRVVVASAGKARRKSPEGRLELCVPPGTERVAVQVSLDGPKPCGAAPKPCAAAPKPCAVAPTPCATAPAPCPPPAAGPCRTLSVSASTETIKSQRNFSDTSGIREPWLSIKNIQKKWIDCRRSGKSTVTRTNSPIVSTTSFDKDPSKSKPAGQCSGTTPKLNKPCGESSPKPVGSCNSSTSKPTGPCGGSNTKPDKRKPIGPYRSSTCKPTGPSSGPAPKSSGLCGKSAPTPANKCKPPSPTRCGGLTKDSKPASKQCTSSAALLAYTTALI